MKVLLHPIPAKYLERLNEPDKGHIKAALKGLEKEPPEGNIIPFSGQRGYFRLKTGGYRIIYRYGDDCIFITHLNPRGQVYNKKNKGGKR